MKKNLKAGDKVLLTPKAAKWFLDNMDVFDSCAVFQPRHSDEVVLAMAICLADKSFEGKVLRVEGHGVKCDFGPLSGFYDFNRNGELEP